ncbi:zinc ribbon domain-containing protein [Erwinia psidii]|uniref:Primosomal protein N' (Replication factor Y)-superfamily II helicase n=1 Tax=Erwinia psidii TaxID=69224 RepID=A0A3N6SQI0_9GAMM|nr:zinc ribbon domain-containing protein [Erwinia psidii]MCX8956772.1 primosomal protein N' (replication factor Y) - superfamily II helicase [Erwinia psidii]MCX8960416.1 primosomal protein N' (replication factor Y) - superfamily II helicase [Erwinia psidii]MCX8964401.1 primosomal protein N' (replication factor Y) - superfamily II helicase [Erwinia psidii]RQM40096.1 primosomal protein N' (replication factor Y) - superfamily II helicase [Erwinia psidii]
MSELCPFCQHLLSTKDGHFHCADCDRAFGVQPVCPDCATPLQVLKACGAVDYFCTSGHGLISKKRVKYILLP